MKQGLQKKLYVKIDPDKYCIQHFNWSCQPNELPMRKAQKFSRTRNAMYKQFSRTTYHEYLRNLIFFAA